MTKRLLAAHVAATVTVLLGFVVDAFARPGGGGSYHGGGGGGNGGGGGGGGGFGGGGLGGGGSFGGGTTYHGTSSGSSGSPLGLLFFIVVAVIVLVIYSRLRRRGLIDGAGFTGQSFGGGGDRGGGVEAPPSLDALRRRDPALTEESVFTHVRQMSEILRTAWCAGDMRPARAFVSDGVFSRFQVQLALMRQENRRNVMSDARVLQTSLQGVEDADPLDVVHVAFTAEARDTEVPVTATDDQIHAALAHARPEPYTEIWSLVRNTGATTKPAEFPVGRACPSCGAPLDSAEVMRCKYCGTLVCSGQHDWVLAEITQTSEWRPRGRPVDGLARLRAADPGIAREALEDRASYLFWKWIQAGRTNSAAPLRKCAAPSFVANGANLGVARTASDVAVGGADLVRCDLGVADGFDRVFVVVSWSARLHGSRDYTPARAMVRMARRAGARSLLSMTSLVCPTCGAPLVESDTTRCDHCGAELAAGDQSWVLEDLSQGSFGDG